VIAKRPIANVAWKNPDRTRELVSHIYWDRLCKLSYPFLDKSDLEKSVSVPSFYSQHSRVHLALSANQTERWKKREVAGAGR